MRYWKTGKEVYIGDPFGDAVELTEGQYNKLVSDSQKERIRSERDKKIQDIEWRIRRYNDEKTLGIKVTENIEPILEYIQALRDVPQQAGFPYEITWPEEL